MNRQRASVAVINRNGHDLFDAAAKGDIKSIKSLLDAGANLEFQHNNRTPLMVASLTGQYDAVKLLIDKKADINAITPDTCWSSLSIAAYNGHLDIVQLLLNSKAAVDVVDSIGWTPLIAATHNGYTSIVNLLLANKADVFQITSQGLSAHIIARNEEYFDIAEILQHEEQRQRELFGEQHALNFDQDNKILSQSSVADFAKSASGTTGVNKQTLLKDIELANELTWQGASKGHIESVYLGIDQGADPLYKGNHPYNCIEAAKLSGNQRCSSFLQAILMYHTRKVKYWSTTDVLLFLEGTLPAHIGSTYIKAAIIAYNTHHPYRYRYLDDDHFQSNPISIPSPLPTPRIKSQQQLELSQPELSPSTSTSPNDEFQFPTYSSTEHPYIIVYNELLEQQRLQNEQKMLDSCSPQSSTQRLSNTASFEYASTLDQIDQFTGQELISDNHHNHHDHHDHHGHHGHHGNNGVHSHLNSNKSTPIPSLHPISNTFFSPTTVDCQLQQHKELPALHQRPLKELIEIVDGPINGYVLISPKFLTLIDAFTTLTTEEKQILHTICLTLRHGSPKPYRIKELLSKYANQFISTEHALDLTSFHEVQMYLSVYKDIISRAHSLSTSSTPQQIPAPTPVVGTSSSTSLVNQVTAVKTDSLPSTFTATHPLIPILILDEPIDSSLSHPATPSPVPPATNVHSLPTSVSSTNGARIGPAAAVLSTHQRTGALSSNSVILKHMDSQKSRQEIAKMALRWWNLIDYDHIKCSNHPNCTRCGIPTMFQGAGNDITSPTHVTLNSSSSIFGTPSTSPHPSGSYQQFIPHSPPDSSSTFSTPVLRGNSPGDQTVTPLSLFHGVQNQPTPMSQNSTPSVLLPITLSTTTTTERRKVIKSDGQNSGQSSGQNSTIHTRNPSASPPTSDLPDTLCMHEPNANSNTLIEIDLDDTIQPQSHFCTTATQQSPLNTASNHLHHHHMPFQKKTKTTTTTTTTTQVVGELSSTYFHTRKTNLEFTSSFLRHQRAVGFTQAYEHAFSSQTNLTVASPVSQKVPQLHVKKSHSEKELTSSSPVTCGFVLKNPDFSHKFRVNLLCDGLLTLPALSAAHRRSLFTCNQHHPGFSITITNLQLLQLAPYLTYSIWLLALHQTILTSFLTLRGRLDNYPVPSHFDPIEYIQQSKTPTEIITNNNKKKSILTPNNNIDPEHYSPNSRYEVNFLGFPEGSNRYKEYVVTILKSNVRACQPSFIPPLDRNLYQLKSRYFTMSVDRLSAQPRKKEEYDIPYAYNFIPIVFPRRILDRISAELKEDVQSAEKEQEQLQHASLNAIGAVRAQQPKSAAWRSLQSAMLKKKFSELQTDTSPTTLTSAISASFAASPHGPASEKNISDLNQFVSANVNVNVIPDSKKKSELNSPKSFQTPTKSSAPTTVTTIGLPALSSHSSSSESNEVHENNSADQSQLRRINNASISVSSSDYGGSASSPFLPQTTLKFDPTGTTDKEGEFVPMNPSISHPNSKPLFQGDENYDFHSVDIDTNRLSMHQKEVLLSAVKLMQSPSLNRRRSIASGEEDLRSSAHNLPRSTSGSKLPDSTGRQSQSPPTSSQSRPVPTPGSNNTPYKRRISRTFDSFELLDDRVSQKARLHHSKDRNHKPNSHDHHSHHSHQNQYKSHNKSRSTGLLLLGQRILRDIEVVCEGNCLQLNLEIARLLGILSADPFQLQHLATDSSTKNLLGLEIPSKRPLDIGGPTNDSIPGILHRETIAPYSFDITWLTELHGAIEKLGLQGFCPDVGNVPHMFSFFTSFLGQFDQLQTFLDPQQQYQQQSTQHGPVNNIGHSNNQIALTTLNKNKNSSLLVPDKLSLASTPVVFDDSPHNTPSNLLQSAFQNSTPSSTQQQQQLQQQHSTNLHSNHHNVKVSTTTRQTNAVLVTTVTTVDIVDSDSSSSSDDDDSSDSDTDAIINRPITTTTTTKTTTTTTTPLNQTTTTTLQRTLSAHKTSQPNSDCNEDPNAHKNKTKTKTSTTTVPVPPMSPNQALISSQKTPQLPQLQLQQSASPILASSFLKSNLSAQVVDPDHPLVLSRPFLHGKTILFDILSIPPQNKSFFGSKKDTPSNSSWNPSKNATAHLIVVFDQTLASSLFMCEHHALLASELDQSRFQKQSHLPHAVVQDTIKTTSLASALGFYSVEIDSDDEPTVVSSPKASKTLPKSAVPLKPSTTIKQTHNGKKANASSKDAKDKKDCTIM